MNNFRFWQKWLFGVGIVIIAMGLFIAFSRVSLFFEISDSLYNPIFWGNQGITMEITKFQLWNFGVMGAIIAGWGVFFAFIAYYPFKNKEKWSWNGVLIGSVLWFCVDTSYSAYYSVYPNVVLNILLFLAIILPLFFTKKEFDQESKNL